MALNVYINSIPTYGVPWVCVIGIDFGDDCKHYQFPIKRTQYLR